LIFLFAKRNKTLINKIIVTNKTPPINNRIVISEYVESYGVLLAAVPILPIIPSNNLAELISDLVRELGPSIVASIGLLLEALREFNEFNRSLQFGYDTVPNLTQYMGIIGEGYRSEILFPGFESQVNTIHRRNLPHLYNAYLNVMEAYSNPNFSRAIRGMSSTNLENFFTIMRSFLQGAENSFNHSYNIYPYLETHRVLDSVRTSGISSAFIMLYYLGRNIGAIFDSIRTRLVSLYPERSDELPTLDEFVNFTIPESEFPFISSRELIRHLHSFEMAREHRVFMLQSAISDLETEQANGNLSPGDTQILVDFRRMVIREQALVDQSRRTRNIPRDLSNLE